MGLAEAALRGCDVQQTAGGLELCETAVSGTVPGNARDIGGFVLLLAAGSACDLPATVAKLDRARLIHELPLWPHHCGLFHGAATCVYGGTVPVHCMSTAWAVVKVAELVWVAAVQLGAGDVRRMAALGVQETEASVELMLPVSPKCCEISA